MFKNKDQVLNYLPHRNPFLFVDAIESVKRANGSQKEITLETIVGTEVTGHYYTNPDHPIFAGHFPEKPILPGVVQVEMMAQVACFAISNLRDRTVECTPDVALLGINNAKFRKPILPGMNLIIKSVCTKSRSTVMTFDCQIFCDNNLMSQSTVLAAINL